MKKIKIKFFGLGYNDLYQADVFVYDDKGNLIYNGKTYNSKIVLELKCNRVYKLVAIYCNDVISVPFYVLNDCEYNFLFNRAQINLNNDSITFLLTDYYYNNLPIERGEMILWQR